MPVYTIIRKSDLQEVTRYAAAAQTEFDSYSFAEYDHVEFIEGEHEQVIQPSDWFINVGPFYDRFGAHKLPILASTDPLVQAIIKDTTVRKYIDLKGRRAELAQAIALLQSKGFAVSETTILDVRPNADEVYRG